MRSSTAKDLYLAIDQGTTSSRAVVFSATGKVIALNQVALPVSFPKDGWVEQDPEQIWQTQLQAIRAVLQEVDASRVQSIGITNQRETTIIWDRASGRALAPAIVWQCRRTQALCDTMRTAGKETIIRERSGLVLDPYFSASKIRWLYEEYPAVRQAIDSGEAACGTVDSWLLYNLTAKKSFLTEPSNASRTMLLGIESCEWDDELLSLWGIPRAVLPTVVSSAGSFGSTSLFGPEIPITGILGDQQAALLGHGCLEKGGVKCTFGTGAFLLLNTGSSFALSETGLLSTVAWKLADGATTYALEGSIFVAGAAIQWLRDQVKLIDTAQESQVIASQAGDSALVVVPSFTGLGAPHWRSEVRGAIFGITRDTSAAQIVRGTLEGCAHQLADLMEDPNFSLVSELKIDGGMSANAVFAQSLASICDVTVAIPTFVEKTALGAARISALGVGDVRSLKEAIATMSEDGEQIQRFTPENDKKQIAEKRRRWKDAIRRLTC